MEAKIDNLYKKKIKFIYLCDKMGENDVRSLELSPITFFINEKAYWMPKKKRSLQASFLLYPIFTSKCTKQILNKQ